MEKHHRGTLLPHQDLLTAETSRASAAPNATSGERYISKVGRLRRALVLCSALALTLLGIWVGNNLVFGGRVRAVPGTPHTFRVQAGVDEAQVRLVAQGLRLADRAFADLLGVRVPRPVTALLARRTPCVPFSRSASTAVADGEMLCVNTTRPVWRYAVREGSTLALSIVAHEHLHNLQGQLGRLPGPDEHTHLWLVEGTATYLGWQTVRRAGRVTEADIAREMRAWGGFRPGLKPLSSYERTLGGDPEYALAHRAVRRLVARTGTPASLVRFCERVGEGQRWRDAFRAAFGLPVGAFYADFERLRTQPR